MSTIYIREQGQLVPLDIPEYRGDRGEAGVTPNLQVGSVTVLPNDQQASVTIQGDKENPTINFEIPSGMTGDKGLYVGRPEDAYNEVKVVFDGENWIDDTYFENSTVDYMGGGHKSLKEKSDSDVEYILRKLGTQHYEGTNITASNTYAKQVKDAVIKGQTLVNIVNSKSFGGNVNFYLYRFDAVKENEKITIFATNPNVKVVRVGQVRVSDGAWAGEAQVWFSHTRKAVYTVTPGFFSDYIGTPVDKGLNSTGHEEDLVILKGDQSHLDITEYFEGMKSVKNPSLVSVGKNLTKLDRYNSNYKNVNASSDGKKIRFDSQSHGSYCAFDLMAGVGVNQIIGADIIDVAYAKSQTLIKGGGTYALSFDIIGKTTVTTTVGVFYDDGKYKNLVLPLPSATGIKHCKTTVDVQNKINFISIDFWYEGANIDVVLDNIQLEQGSQVTSYEPYKSNTLVTPSDLELRSNGNVYDELDLMTGKLTQRIGEDGTILTQEVVKTIDLKGQKFYSYDGTTHCITSSMQGHLNPILSIDVPTNITSLLKHQQNTINQQRLILSKREEMQNILIESMLSRYEQTLLTATCTSKEEVPNYIQKLYEVAYKRGIRTKEGEL